MINIVHHPFRGEETLRLTNNCLSPNLPVRRGDDDDVVVTDAPPPLPTPRIRTRGTSFSSCSVENKREQIPYLLTHFKVPNFDIRNGTREMVRRDGGKAGQTMGRDATHHGRSVAKSPGHGAEASIICLSLYRLIGIAAAGRRTRPHQLLGFSTPYIIYITDSRGGGMYPTTSASVLRDDYLYARSRGGGGWKGGGGGGGASECAFRTAMVCICGEEGRRGGRVNNISQGLMKFSVNEQSTIYYFFKEASCLVFGECAGHYFCPRRSIIVGYISTICTPYLGVLKT